MEIAEISYLLSCTGDNVTDNYSWRCNVGLILRESLRSFSRLLGISKLIHSDDWEQENHVSGAGGCKMVLKFNCVSRHFSGLRD